jgi:hypothetical protein
MLHFGPTYTCLIPVLANVLDKLVFLAVSQVLISIVSAHTKWNKAWNESQLETSNDLKSKF